MFTTLKGEPLSGLVLTLKEKVHQRVETNLKWFSPDNIFFHVTVLAFAVTHSGYKLLLTQYLFNVYSDFIKKQNEICKRVMWACPECFWKCSFSRSCRGQSTAFKNRNFRKLELSLWLIHHEFRSTVQSVWNPSLCFWWL